MSDMLTKIAEGMNAKLDGEGLSPSIGLDIDGLGRIFVGDQGAIIGDTDADCEISMKTKTFEGLLSGKVNPMTAVMLGKIKIRGDMKAAMSLSKLLG